MYNNQYDLNNFEYPYEFQDDRFLFTPFLVGGLAGTALGLGIANNNQMNNGQYNNMPAMYPAYPFFPAYQQYPICPNCPNSPQYTTSNNYYY